MFLIAVVGFEDKVTVDATVGIRVSSVRGITDITGISILLTCSIIQWPPSLVLTINCEVVVSHSVKLDWPITRCSVQQPCLHQKWDSP